MPPRPSTTSLTYTPTHHQYLLQGSTINKSFSRQFSHVYVARLLKLKKELIQAYKSQSSLLKVQSLTLEEDDNNGNIRKEILVEKLIDIGKTQSTPPTTRTSNNNNT